MDVVVELTSAAVPLNPQALFTTLHAAASSDQVQVQAAAQQLQTWETQRGYHSLLQDVFIDESLPFEVRYLAIIQLKNGVDKYWRKTATNGIGKDEKAFIRGRLVQSGINAADRRLSLHNALVTAKVARFDYPREWPNLMSSIVAHLRAAVEPGANPLVLSRVLVLLLQLVKELATARLARSRASLESITPEIVFVLCGIYVSRVEQWRRFLDQGGEDEGAALDAIEQTLAILKILRRLLVAGYEYPHKDAHVGELWLVVKGQFGEFLRILAPESALSADVRQWVDRHLMQFSKLHLEMARVHSTSFVLLPESLDLARAYWNVVAQYAQLRVTPGAPQTGRPIGMEAADDDKKPLVERLALKSLLLLRACVKMVFNPAHIFKYRAPEFREEQQRCRDVVKNELLTEALVRHIMEVVVSRLLVFSADDLREWAEEPEEWERREESEGDGWEFSIRPCAEKLFLDIMHHFKDVLSEPLLAVFGQVSRDEGDDLLFKDAVYAAIGLAAPLVHQQLDFDGFLNSRLVREVQESRPGYNIVRRRIAILLGQWVAVRIAAANRPLVYQIFQHLLNSNDPLNDQIVRVTAGKHFRHVADEMEFDGQAFVPYASHVLGGIRALIEAVELSDTKMALLNTLTVVIERMDQLISPFSETIVSLLPTLWEQSGNEHLLKQAILTVLTKVIEAMKENSRQYHALVVPLIMHAVEPGSESQVYLLEDALDLWATILQQTPDSAAHDVLPLAPYLFAVYELGTENLRKALQITESYVILAPAQMLDTEMRQRLLSALTSMLGSLKSEANGLVMRLLDVIVCEAQLAGGEQAVAVVTASMVETGLLPKVVGALRGCWKARQTLGPLKKAAPIDGIIETDYLCLLARIVLAHPRRLRAVPNAPPPPPPPPPTSAPDAPEGEADDEAPQTASWLLDEWLAHFGNIGRPTHRKLNCLALASLLEMDEPWVLDRLQDLMAVWTDVLAEVQEGNEEPGRDNLVWEDGGDFVAPTGPEAPEDRRRRLLAASDPIRRINAVEHVRSHLQRIIMVVGGQQRFQSDWLANVDADVIRSFGKLCAL